MQYTVRRPIGTNLDSEGMVVTRHRTLDGARKSLKRQCDGARQQGGYSRDYIFCDSLGLRVLAEGV